MNRKLDQKQRTHEQIVEAAGRLFRQDGVRPVGIGQIMDSIGLTVGGFYNHFESKDALFAAVVDSAVSNTVESEEADRLDSADYVRTLAGKYLSAKHRDNPALGCPLPSLSADVARGDAQVRAAYTRFVSRVAGKLADKLDDTQPEFEGAASDERALSVIALSVGGLLLARAVDDAELSDRILAACREAVERI